MGISSKVEILSKLIAVILDVFLAISYDPLCRSAPSSPPRSAEMPGYSEYSRWYLRHTPFLLRFQAGCDKWEAQGGLEGI